MSININDIPLNVFMNYLEREDLADRKLDEDKEDLLINMSRMNFKIGNDANVGDKNFTLDVIGGMGESFTKGMMYQAMSDKVTIGEITNENDSNNLYNRVTGYSITGYGENSVKLYLLTSNGVALPSYDKYISFSRGYLNEVNNTKITTNHFIRMSIVDGNKVSFIDRRYLNNDPDRIVEWTDGTLETNWFVIERSLDENDKNDVVKVYVMDGNRRVEIGIYGHNDHITKPVYVKDGNEYKKVYLDEFGQKVYRSEDTSQFEKHATALRKGIYGIEVDIDNLTLPLQPETLSIAQQGAGQYLGYSRKYEMENSIIWSTTEDMNFIYPELEGEYETIGEYIRDHWRTSPGGDNVFEYDKSQLTYFHKSFDLNAVPNLTLYSFNDSSSITGISLEDNTIADNQIVKYQPIKIKGTANIVGSTKVLDITRKYYDISKKYIKYNSSYNKTNSNGIESSELTGHDYLFIASNGSYDYILDITTPYSTGGFLILPVTKKINKNRIEYSTNVFGTTYKSNINNASINPPILIGDKEYQVLSNSGNSYIRYYVSLEHSYDRPMYIGKTTNISKSAVVKKYKLEKVDLDNTQLIRNNAANLNVNRYDLLEDNIRNLDTYKKLPDGSYKKLIVYQDIINPNIKVGELITIKHIPQTSTEFKEFLVYNHSYDNVGYQFIDKTTVDSRKVKRGSQITKPMVYKDFIDNFRHGGYVSDRYLLLGEDGISETRGAPISDTVYRDIVADAMFEISNEFLSRDNASFIIGDNEANGLNEMMKTRIYLDGLLDMLANRRIEDIGFEGDGDIIKSNDDVLVMFKETPPEMFEMVKPEPVNPYEFTEELNAYQRLYEYDKFPTNDSRSRHISNLAERETIMRIEEGIRDSSEKNANIVNDKLKNIIYKDQYKEDLVKRLVYPNSGNPLFIREEDETIDIIQKDYDEFLKDKIQDAPIYNKDISTESKYEIKTYDKDDIDELLEDYFINKYKMKGMI